MSDHTPAPGGSGGEPDSSGAEPGAEPDVPGEDHEAAMMRELMRKQEQHREGGVDRDLDDADGGAEPGA